MIERRFFIGKTNVPFINGHFDNPSKLEWETIYQRLVVENRGGVCYERDEVLWQLLNKIGYQVMGFRRFRHQ